MIDLYVTFRSDDCSRTMKTTFPVVDIPSAYNVIIDRLTLNRFHVIVLTYYITLKFPTSVGVEIVKSDL